MPLPFTVSAIMMLGCPAFKEEKAFNKIELSAIGINLVNSLEETIDEFGDSISEAEKRTILMNLLEKYI